jgi:hypothetical protein
MSTPKNNKNIHENNESVKLSWNQALEDAKAQLGECRLRSAKLRAAIKYFKKQMTPGEPFPVGNESVTPNQSASLN